MHKHNPCTLIFASGCNLNHTKTKMNTQQNQLFLYKRRTKTQSKIFSQLPYTAATATKRRTNERTNNSFTHRKALF